MALLLEWAAARRFEPDVMAGKVDRLSVLQLAALQPQPACYQLLYGRRQPPCSSRGPRQASADGSMASHPASPPSYRTVMPAHVRCPRTGYTGVGAVQHPQWLTPPLAHADICSVPRPDPKPSPSPFAAAQGCGCPDRWTLGSAEGGGDQQPPHQTPRGVTGPSAPERTHSAYMPEAAGDSDPGSEQHGPDCRAPHRPPSPGLTGHAALPGEAYATPQVRRPLGASTPPHHMCIVSVHSTV